MTSKAVKKRINTSEFTERFGLGHREGRSVEVCVELRLSSLAMILNRGAWLFRISSYCLGSF